jgi:SAM-dependent methyltransferase
MVRYEERFRHAAAVQAYDEEEYAEGSYATFIWTLQQPVLDRVVRRLRERSPTVKALDFACGTGRIVTFLKPRVDELVGVDTSAAMLTRAASRVQQVELIAGDITADPAVANDRYDLVTAFRFLLNAEDSVKLAALRALRARINDQHGVLVANVHGNRFSLRHLAIAVKRRRIRRPSEALLHEMSLEEIERLLREAGFRITEWHGFGIVPEGLHRTPVRFLARWVDRLCAGTAFARRVSIDLLIVCAPILEHL